jgi:hypothetical protein
VRRNHSELIVLHHYHSDHLPDPRPAIEHLRSLPSRPTIAVTCGDAFYNGFFRPALPRMFLQAAEVADVVFLSSMGDVADHICRSTTSPVALLPLGACQVRFQVPAERGPRRRPEFRVVFIGSNNRSRSPFKSYHWYARRRERLVRRLSSRFGQGFGLFGHGWKGFSGWRGPTKFDEQAVVCRQSEVVVGGVPFSPARYYMSNRPFNQIISGVPFVDIAVAGIETILRDGEHWHLVSDIDAVVDQCEALLSLPPDVRREQGMAAAEFVAAHHTEVERCRSLIATLTGVRQANTPGRQSMLPDLRFFLPEVDIQRELPLATRGSFGSC